jgi:hypothetical protein
MVRMAFKVIPVRQAQTALRAFKAFRAFKVRLGSTAHLVLKAPLDLLVQTALLAHLVCKDRQAYKDLRAQLIRNCFQHPVPGLNLL